jgi:Na+/melibiose symporter-like transporter
LEAPIQARTLKSILAIVKLLVVTSAFNTFSGIFSGFITVYFAKYLEDEADLGTGAYGIILSVGIGLYLMTVIVSGAFSDDFRSERWGNRVPFITIGGMLMGTLFILTYGVLEIFGASLFIMVILFGGIYIANGIVSAPNNALMSELFEKNMRGWAALTRMLFATLGSAIAIFTFPSLADSGNYEEMFMIIAIVLFVCSGIVALFVPKLNPDFEPDETIPDILATPQYLATYGRGDFGKLLICQVFWALGTGAVNYFWVAYLYWKFDVTAQEIATMLLVLSIAAALAALPVGIMVATIGKVNTGIVSSLLYCVFVFLIATAPSMGPVYLYVVLGGIAAIGLSTVQGSLPADLVPEGKEGQFMGINTVFSLFPDPITLGIAAIILAVFPEKRAYQLLFSLVILEVLIAAIALIFITYEDWVGEKYNHYYTRFLRAKNKLPDRTWLGISISEYFEDSKKELEEPTN